MKRVHRGFRAKRLLPLGSALAVLMLLSPLPGSRAADPPNQDAAHWIKQLGSSQYVVRLRAARQLVHMGIEAFDALKAAESDPDLEIAAQARYLAQRIRVTWVKETDSE